MNNIYIIVEKNRDSYGDTLFVTRNSDREVLHYAGIISSASGLDDQKTIERIFSVNETGKVTHYGIIFKDGKLKLETLPEVR